MTRDLAHTSTESGTVTRSTDWGAVWAIILALVVFAAWWGIFHFTHLNQAYGSTFVLAALLLVVVHGLLVILLERSLLLRAMSTPSRYRLAVFSIALLAIGYLSVDSLSQPTFDFFRTLLLVIAAFAGGFGGALILTWIREGLAENNSPPDESIQESVKKLHYQRIQQGDPLNVWKRAFDILAAALGIILSAPIWIASCILIWIENPGPLLFVKNSVTRGGNNFRQYKFRTMVRGAEEGTGPVLAKEKDERVLYFGRFLRKTALDELPQLINILRGEMSFVGPRPQRTVLVADYLQSMPEYAERHRVLPGLAGLAQVAGDYYLTPRQKLRFDRLYIQHANLGFDLKLLGLAFLITFWYRWQPDWNGRLPRRFLHRQSR